MHRSIARKIIRAGGSKDLRHNKNTSPLTMGTVNHWPYGIQVSPSINIKKGNVNTHREASR
uniref:Uncharacterized protein n=1 Tax=Lepeophtheirus salmonis TaxID=72036 RepID=A0A0K2UBA2_LEPSM